MRPSTAYIIGLRLSPERENPEWYTLWFENASGQNRVVLKNGRIQWSSSIEGARNLGHEIPDLIGVGESTFDAVSDAAGTLYALQRSSEGDESLVLLFLNLLDDTLNTAGQVLQPETKRLLDRLSAMLTEGATLQAAVESLGGSQGVIEAVFACLGRVLVWSDFVC